MSRADIHARACGEAADFLDGIGEKKRANDVRAMLRSYSTSRTTNSALHRDNMELRSAAGQGPRRVSETALAIGMDMTLDGPLRERFEAECLARQCEPAALMADIIANVIQDDLFAAVIDQ